MIVQSTGDTAGVSTGQRGAEVCSLGEEQGGKTEEQSTRCCFFPAGLYRNWRCHSQGAGHKCLVISRIYPTDMLAPNVCAGSSLRHYF